MICEQHDWRGTYRAKHVSGPETLFKYGTPVVTYVRCDHCGQVGFRRPGSMVVYTWKQ